MRFFAALIAGLIFGFGLIISGMTNPAKVIGFLDLAGRWDPSLAFVMGGAIAIGMPAFWFAKKREKAFLGDSMLMPTTSKIDLPLVFGSLLFGIGWGIAGFCPGPALVSITAGSGKPLIFVMAMLGGMLIFELMRKERVGSTI